jgi:uncharacterized protein YjbI with pentapeptide repeats
MNAITQPVVPKLLPQLDDWSGKISDEIELQTSAVQDKNFANVRRLEVEGCRLTALQLGAARFDKLRLSDVTLYRVEAAGMRAPEGSALRMVCKDSRLTGVDLGEALLEDCVFENVKLDEVGFRFAVLKRVRFVSCVLRNADFSGAKFSNVTFSACELNGANFDNATCKFVDLRGENIAAIKGVMGLKGATVSSEQLIQLAPLLAAEAGLDVDYEVE